MCVRRSTGFIREYPTQYHSHYINIYSYICDVRLGTSIVCIDIKCRIVCYVLIL